MAVNNISAASGKKRGITAIDIAIILAVLAIIASVVLRVINSRLESVSSTGCSISFTVSGIRYSDCDYINEGDTVFIGDERLGTLGRLSVVPGSFCTADAAGQIIECSYPDSTFSDISGSISCELICRDGSFIMSDGTRICAGGSFTVSTRLADFEILVTSVERTSAG